VLHFLALFAFLTFPTLSIERLLEQLWSAILSAMVSLASMAMSAEVFGIINFVPLIYYEKSATRNVFLREKKFPRRNLLKASSWVHIYKSFVTFLDRSCMTFVPLALSKDTTHLYSAGCRETMWEKRLCLRKRRPSDQNQVVLSHPTTWTTILSFTYSVGCLPKKEGPRVGRIS